jgi:hypothetical protein
MCPLLSLAAGRRAGDTRPARISIAVRHGIVDASDREIIAHIV